MNTRPASTIADASFGTVNTARLLPCAGPFCSGCLLGAASGASSPRSPFRFGPPRSALASPFPLFFVCMSFTDTADTSPSPGTSPAASAPPSSAAACA